MTMNVSEMPLLDKEAAALREEVEGLEARPESPVREFPFAQLAAVAATDVGAALLEGVVGNRLEDEWPQHVHASVSVHLNIVAVP